MSFITSANRAVRVSTSVLQPLRTSITRTTARTTASASGGAAAIRAISQAHRLGPNSQQKTQQQSQSQQQKTQKQKQQQTRPFHESSSDKAVEAVSSAQPKAFQPPPPAPFAPHNTTQNTAASFLDASLKAKAAVAAGQLNMIAEAYKPTFYESISEIMRLRKEYVKNRAVFVESKDMIPLLLGLGANRSDLADIQLVSNNLYLDPTLPFRRSRSGRFCIDFDNNTLRRLEFQPFLLSIEEDFKRHDSGQVRRFDEIYDNLQCNSAFQALFAYKAMMIHGVETAQRPKLEYGVNKWVCTLFNLRTVTTPDILGEPALEGVHSDGVDHTMTSYLGSTNMADECAATFMHDMAETTGIQLQEINPEHLLMRVQHKNLLDTLLIADHERKHSLSPVRPVDASKEALRDMLIFFTRKPVEATHVSGSFDSLKSHPELPMEIPLFLPGRQ